ncbi:MAG TPA: sulfatase-like hydrolase/transferase [Pirellulales bacterium]|nr:sulfatase-like hydrolase/transferase [Pirellulales bacterium]
MNYVQQRIRIVACCSMLLLIGTITSYAASAKTPRPNIVVMLTDDQGWGDLSVHGNTNLQTPAADSLARDGAMFERFYVSPVCSPTRAEFLTGRYHPRGGVFSTSTGGERLDLDERTIAQVFQQAGYATGAFGKWHNGTQFPYHPRGRGFDEFYGFCSGHWGDYFDPPLEHNGQPVRGRGFISDDFTDHALSFIEANRGGPFFCYLALNTPHSPMQVPENFYEKFAGAEIALRHAGPEREDVAMTRAALAMCESNDGNLARVLAKLDELKLANDTIVVFFCDNGPNSWRWNGGMKGRKGSTDEGGVRAPLLVRWPGHVPPGTRIKSPAAAIDLLPTLAGLAGVSAKGEKPLDGVDLSAVLRDPATPAPARLIFAHWTGSVSARDEHYLLDGNGQLFDLATDPGQSRNIRRERPEVAERMSAAVADWRRDVLSELTKEPRPFTVGYREFPLTVLPARDGAPHGGVKRSARAPNCSFFTGWTNTDDSITWDIAVATAGRYKATAWYTCPAADVGSTIELRFGASHVTAKIAEAHDPPLVGAEHDRVPREGESLVKDFRPLELGLFALPAEQGKLTLRATAVPGKSVMDLRGVTLELLTD